MHDSVLHWVAEKVREHPLEGEVLEVGSLDVNGSVRPLLAGARSYLGVDMQAGRGVDRLMNAHELLFPDATFDLVVCTEMLEHDDQFWTSLSEMGRVLRPGGHLLLTARGNGFMPHGYPDDFWRFMPNAFPRLFQLAGCSVIELREDWQPGHPGLFGLGRKE